MSYQHKHNCHSHHSHKIGDPCVFSNKSSNIRVAFLLNLSFALIELIGGYITNSSAIISDAIHDFGDSLSLGSSLLFEKYSSLDSNDRYNFGYHRLSLIGAIINVIVLSIGVVFIFINAINSLINYQQVNSEGMLVLVVLGIFVNGVSVFRMKDGKNILDHSVIIHLIEDLLGWVIIFIGAIVIYFTDYYFIDPILAFIILGINIRNIYKCIKDIISIIMNENPDLNLYNKIKLDILAIEDIISLDKIQLWSIDGDQHLLNIRVSVSKDNNILNKIKDIIKDTKIIDSTIEIVVVK